MTEFEKELNNFLTNEIGLEESYRTVEKYSDNYVSTSTKIYIGGFYEKLSIEQLIQIENFLKKKLGINKIYIEVCDIDAGYAISWE